ncbi:amino acid adenylation domain-containing protein [Mycobacterium intracellulare]|uniref:amino acid adenylation domain-containing protein n=1 Tax=Mycobacterium intracellulare TaxID=1767 RepID=UPI001EEEA2F7|nr:amino acid adenylation domain-containing protein [Mycobacterium intracellulare]MEE3755348.1 amino acid adenylation domain-containing protein [Mycobacterium intracellulare]
MTVREISASPTALAAHAALNDTLADYPHQPVGELFARQAAERPDHPAICCGERVITYRELHAAATRLAHTLLRQGAGPGDVIAVALPRSPELITAVLAILLCGASYLPIDVQWPQRRIRELLDAAHVRRCIAIGGAARSQLFDRTVIDVSAQPGPDAAWSTLPAVGPDAIAYINFTSGSTGQPKGVPISHRSISRLVFATRYAPLPPAVRVLHMAPVTFDAATFEIWGPLLRGGACVIYPDPFIRVVKLGRVIATHRVDVVFVTTALFNTIIDDAPEIFDRVDTILTGGEAHSIRHIRRALQRYGPGRVVSVYGPTESTTFATYYPINRLAANSVTVPIGTPIQNTRAYLIGEDRLCAPGDIGALHLAGPGLTRGYLGLPERTSTDFISARIGATRERLYHTGDLAYLDTDGQLVFCGRSDDQLKINGFRIELGDIRHHIEAVAAVRATYVTVYEPCPGQRALAAFIVAESPDRAGGLADAVHQHLTAHLPAYMIPKMLAVVDELPLGDTGKINRTALLSPTRAART